jgi:hypothetical protein
MSELTDPRIFVAELVCAECKLPIAEETRTFGVLLAPASRVAAENECACTEVHDLIERDYRSFVSGAEEVPDIYCERGIDGAARVEFRQDPIARVPPGRWNEEDPDIDDDDRGGVPVEQRYVVHSPTGFEWAYSGSGPADLALNILALFVAPPEAWRLHQRYKREVIATLPRLGGLIRADHVRTWIRLQWQIEKAAS